MYASISELKARLSHYLRRVQRGETVLVRHRDRVVARLEPVGASVVPAGDAGWIDELERQGTIRRSARKLPAGWLSGRPRVKADVVAALLAEREEGR